MNMVIIMSTMLVKVKNSYDNKYNLLNKDHEMGKVDHNINNKLQDN
jgi:hypothetical protein